MPTYLSLFIFGFLYQLFLVYNALRMKNTIQIIGLCLYNVGLLVEAAVQSDQVHDAIHNLGDTVDNPNFWDDTRPFIIAVPCVLALGTCCMAFLTWKLYHEFAWSIYKDISADLRLKRRFLSYQVSSDAPSSNSRLSWLTRDAPDLYCLAQIRFLLLFGLHRSILGRGQQNKRLGEKTNVRRHTDNYYLVVPCSVLG